MVIFKIQIKYFKCIKILFTMIERQTYKNIRKWVIVEESQNKFEADKNKKNIKQFIGKINYIEYSGKK